MSRNIFQKSVAEAMKEYAPVYPESRKWIDTAEYLLKHEGDIIAELQRQYLKFGQFREPVVLRLNDADEDVEELSSGTIGYVADGTHRLVSAYLLGVESILVSDSFEESAKSDYSIVTQISTVSKRSLSEDENGTLFDKLRSVCISESLWITSSTASGSPSGVSVYWDEYDSTLIPTINSAVINKLAEIFPEESFDVETICEAWEF